MGAVELFQSYEFSGGPKNGDYLRHVVPVYLIWELFWDPEAEDIRGLTHVYRFSPADGKYLYEGIEEE